MPIASRRRFASASSSPIDRARLRAQPAGPEPAHRPHQHRRDADPRHPQPVLPRAGEAPRRPSSRRSGSIPWSSTPTCPAATRRSMAATTCARSAQRRVDGLDRRRFRPPRHARAAARHRHPGRVHRPPAQPRGRQRQARRFRRRPADGRLPRRARATAASPMSPAPLLHARRWSAPPGSRPGSSRRRRQSIRAPLRGHATCRRRAAKPPRWLLDEHSGRIADAPSSSAIT